MGWLSINYLRMCSWMSQSIFFLAGCGVGRWVEFDGKNGGKPESTQGLDLGGLGQLGKNG